MNTLFSWKFTLLFLALLPLSALVEAQNNTAGNAPYGQVSIASPTAAALAKYVDIPVNYHTGIPTVDIPIYTVQEGSLSLPLSLSYHAGGVKVMEPAGWVGTGWALNAGGVITRSVVGTPDEKGTTFKVEYGHFSDYGFSSYATVGGNHPPFPGYAGSNILQNDMAFATGKYDGEPDLYFFNFNGYSGKFYFNDDRTPMIIDGQDLKIEYYYPTDGTTPTAASSAARNIQGFIVTVPTGDKYYFGITDNAASATAKPIEKSFLYTYAYSSANDNVYSSYYLSKIVAADGIHKIDFTYESEKYSFYSISLFPVVGGDDRSGSQPDPREYNLVKNNVDGVRLKKISFSSGSVEFGAAGAARLDIGKYGYDTQLYDEPNTESKALSSITINGADFCKKFGFEYSYFTDNTTTSLVPGLQAPAGITTDKSRLKLDKVTESACDGSLAINPWKFDYQKDVNNQYFLPRRLSFAQDHWGFYNGADANNSPLCNTLIATYTAGSPTGPGGTVYPGANRDASWPHMAYGVLTTVTYPTGGNAVFEYEPNTVWVNFRKYEYQPPTIAGVSRQWSAHYWNNYTFKAGTYYRIKVDYIPAANCTASGPSSVLFSDGIIGNNAVSLVASRQVPHAERIFTPAGGTRRITLDIDSECENDQGSLSMEEITLRNVQQNAFAGGLRIKTTTAKENSSATGLITSYNYQDAAGHSSGTLYSRPRYVQAIRNKEIQEYGFSTWTGPQRHLEYLGCLGVSNDAQGNTLPQTYLKSPSGIIPLSTTQGNHIGYDQVTVTRPGNGRSVYTYYEYNNDSNTLGKIVDDVCYRNLLQGCDPSTPYLPAPPPRYEFRRGQLKNASVYSEAGRILKSTQYDYAYDSSKIATLCKLAKIDESSYIGTYYERKTYRKIRTETTETDYSPDGAAVASVTKTVLRYESPYHQQLSRSTETTSAGDVVEKKNQYVFDFRAPTVEAISDGTATYKSACATCDATYNESKCTGFTDYVCRRTAYWDNIICRMKARKDYIAYRRANFTNSTNNFQTAHINAKNSADAVLKPLLQLQDDYTNLLVETSQWRNGQLLSASSTTFAPGLTQPATMYPAKQFGLFLPAPAAAFAPAVVSGNTVAFDSRYATVPETVLKFDKGTLAEVTPRTGILTSYVWGYNNTLPLVKAIGVSYATLSAAYSRAGGDLPTLRRDPALAKALLTTYAHQPLVGLTGQTDPSGRATRYEYDALGRLLRVRDEQGRILTQQEYKYANQF